MKILSRPIMQLKRGDVVRTNDGPGSIVSLAALLPNCSVLIGLSVRDSKRTVFYEHDMHDQIAIESPD